MGGLSIHLLPDENRPFCIMAGPRLPLQHDQAAACRAHGGPKLQAPVSEQSRQEL